MLSPILAPKTNGAAGALGLGDMTAQQLAQELEERRKKALRSAKPAGFGAAGALLGESGGQGTGGAY